MRPARRAHELQNYRRPTSLDVLFESSVGGTLDQAAIHRVIDANGGHHPTHVTMRFGWEG